MKDEGNVGSICISLVCVLMMLIIVVTFFDKIGLIMTKLDTSEIARKYIIEMETEGYLSKANEDKLIEELTLKNLSEISLQGTDLAPVGYGNTIKLKIKAKTRDGEWIEEFKTSIAKY